MSDSYTRQQSEIWGRAKGICAKNNRRHWRWCEACFPEAFRQHGVKSESNLTGSVVKKPVEKVRQVHAPVEKVVEIEKTQYIEKIIEKPVEKVS